MLEFVGSLFTSFLLPLIPECSEEGVGFLLASESHGCTTFVAINANKRKAKASAASHA